MKILVVEDDRRLAEVLQRGLCESGHSVEVAYDGIRGRAAAADGRHDAIVLDVMLPGCDGLSVVREMRRRAIPTPVLLLTSRDTTEDAIAGLDAGADDYLRKPFVFGELEARLRAIARRREPLRAWGSPSQRGDAERTFEPSSCSTHTSGEAHRFLRCTAAMHVVDDQTVGRISLWREAPRALSGG